MQKKLVYTFSLTEMQTLDLVICEYLTKYEIDFDFLDESLSKLVLFEWYKRNLSKFKFPQEKNKVTFKQTEYIAFLSHFREVDHYMIQHICQEVTTLLTGGTLSTKKLL
jgi:hypothetical protein